MKTSIDLDHANLKVFFYGSDKTQNINDVVHIDHADNLMVLTDGEGLTSLLNFNNVNAVRELKRGADDVQRQI